MEKVTGTIASKSRKGNSIKIGDDWYSTFSADDLNHVNWKDEVEFLYEQKGQYKNIKGKVQLVGSGASPSKSGGGSGGGYSSIGVELGHAANLAMRMMEQQAGDANVGSADYYKEFTEHTVNMYKVMKAIRAKVEASGGEAKSETKTPAPSTDISDDDLF